MSREEVQISYGESVSPPEHVISLIDNIVRKTVESKKNLVHLLNIISHRNKDDWFPEFESMVKNEWNCAKNSIFASTAMKQRLYTDIYVELMDRLNETDQHEILNIISKVQLTSADMKTTGIFLGKWASYIKLTNSYLEEYFSQDMELRVGVILHTFITLHEEGNSHSIPISIYNKVKNLDHHTSTLMVLYDLEELMESVKD